MTDALLEVPSRAAEVLDQHDAIQALAQRIAQARDVLYLGRGNCFPIALEGALKLKEISYIHAEGYAAGEMKHGPIALIDRAVPVIAIAPSGPLFEKTASNLQEAAARGGQVIVFSDAAGAAKLRGIADGDDRAAGGRSVRGADPVRDPGAVAGLSRGGAEGHRRGSAAQSGEVGDGGVAQGNRCDGDCRVASLLISNLGLASSSWRGLAPPSTSSFGRGITRRGWPARASHDDGARPTFHSRPVRNSQ